MTKLSLLLSAHDRGVGHTHAAVKVALESKAVLVVASQEQGMEIWRQNPLLTIIPLHKLERLQGLGRPIVVDHFALQVILDEAQRVADQLNDANRRLQDQIAKLKTKRRK